MLHPSLPVDPVSKLLFEAYLLKTADVKLAPVGLKLKRQLMKALGSRKTASQTSGSAAS